MTGSAVRRGGIHDAFRVAGLVEDRFQSAEECLELRTSGSQRLARRASRRARQMDLGMRGSQTPGTITGGRFSLHQLSSLCSTCTC